MSKVVLVEPTKQYAEQVMAYRNEMLKNKDSFDGCAGLEEVHSFEEWIDFEALGIVSVHPNVGKGMHLKCLN